MVKKHQFNYRFDHSDREKVTSKKSKKRQLKTPYRVAFQVILFLAFIILNVMTDSVVNNNPSVASLSAQVETIQENNFIRELAPIAQQQEKATGLKASITLAQACLESDYGRSLLSSKYNNLFGIKAYGNEPSVTMNTKEYVNGKWVTIQGVFRTYNSWTASVEDHTSLFVNGVTWDVNHYKNILTAATYQEAAEDLQKDGYATDPSYTEKILALIETHQLYKYDA